MAKGTSLVKLQLESAQYEQKLRQAKRDFNDFASSIGINMKQMTAFGITTAAASQAISALTQELQQAVTQSIELAKAAQGIEVAFQRLNNPGLLDKLREATHGTVNDIELMKAAVKFNDFKLPVEELGTMLAFAQQKAKDTGQSVDYMVDSIVTGLGRKSLMILDNLGLSATEIKDKMAETGDMTKAVGEIIREQMSNAGDYVETAADRAAQATARVENALLELGKTIGPLQTSGVDAFTEIKVASIELLNEGLQPIALIMEDLNGLLGDIGTGTQIVHAGFKLMAKSMFEIAKNSVPLLGAFSTILKLRGMIGKNEPTNFDTAIGGSIGSLISVLNGGTLPDVVITAPKKSKTKTTKTTAAKAEAVAQTFMPVDPNSILGMTNQLRELASVQQLASDTGSWEHYQKQIDVITDRIKVMKGEMSQVEFYYKYSNPEEYNALMSAAKSYKPKKEEKPKEDKTSVTAIASQIGGGVNSIASGIEQLGVDLPQGFKDVLGGINAVTTILTGIAAICTVIQTLTSIQTATSPIPFFAKGGIARAAGGFAVPGNRLSGDRVPALLNSQELVLNRAQTGIIASALNDSKQGVGYVAQPYVTGEQIFLGLNAWSRRSGRGEIVTSKR